MGNKIDDNKPINHIEDLLIRLSEDPSYVEFFKGLTENPPYGDTLENPIPSRPSIFKVLREPMGSWGEGYEWKENRI